MTSRPRFRISRRGSLRGAHRRPCRSGHTLVELVAILVAFGIALAIATPAFRRGLDGLGVRAARDAIVVEAARARLLARVHGGAALILDADRGAIWVEAVDGDTITAPIEIAARYHARIDLGGDASAAIRYDRIGLGRLASRSVRMVRGDAVARFTISAYGRVRVW